MKFPYGEANFEKIRSEGYFYVDKTRYIELLEHLQASHVVMLRSRRFGKTLFINMLGYYYDQLRADKFDALFDGLYIHSDPTPKRGSYMVLTFNFSGINTETLKNANAGFIDEIRSSVALFLERYHHHFLETEKQNILQPQTSNGIIANLFKILSRKESGKCVYVLIDEYDHLANNILSQGKEMFKDLVRTDGYVRPFYEALKVGTETVVDRMFITGVMPILLDSLTSGFNIGMNISTEEKFNEMFGFTEEEITPILEYLGTETRRERLRTYYDGYRFSPKARKRLYNSDMILFYALKYEPETDYIESMIDTNVVSDYRKIRAILSIGDRDLEEAILTRIVGVCAGVSQRSLREEGQGSAHS